VKTHASFVKVLDHRGTYGKGVSDFVCYVNWRRQDGDLSSRTALMSFWESEHLTILLRCGVSVLHACRYHHGCYDMVVLYLRRMPPLVTRYGAHQRTTTPTQIERAIMNNLSSAASFMNNLSPSANFK